MNQDKYQYVLDTNSIIALHRRLEPKDKPPNVFEKIEGVIAQSDIFLANEVINELSKIEDEIYEWAKNQTSRDPKRNHHLIYQEKVEELVKKYSKSYTQITINGGYDLHIIAWGKILNATVITEEKLKENAEKIPNICEKEGVKCKNILEMFEDYDWYS